MKWIDIVKLFIEKFNRTLFIVLLIITNVFFFIIIVFKSMEVNLRQIVIDNGYFVLSLVALIVLLIWTYLDKLSADKLIKEARNIELKKKEDNAKIIQESLKLFKEIDTGELEIIIHHYYSTVNNRFNDKMELLFHDDEIEKLIQRKVIVSTTNSVGENYYMLTGGFRYSANRLLNLNIIEIIVSISGNSSIRIESDTIELNIKNVKNAF